MPGTPPAIPRSAIAGTSRMHSRITKVIRNASTWLRVSDDAKQPMAA